MLFFNTKIGNVNIKLTLNPCNCLRFDWIRKCEEKKTHDQDNHYLYDRAPNKQRVILILYYPVRTSSFHFHTTYFCVRTSFYFVTTSFLSPQIMMSFTSDCLVHIFIYHFGGTLGLHTIQTTPLKCVSSFKYLLHLFKLVDALLKSRDRNFKYFKKVEK